MHVGVIGLNHQSCLAIREQLANFVEQKVLEKVESPLLVLSTCNRVEIYFGGDDLTVVHSELIGLLREHLPLSVEQELYTFFGVECFYHLSRVASGLDSQILLEGQIQHQVKKSYMMASLDRELSADFHYLFQKALQIGKEMRTRFPAFQTQNTLERHLYSLCQNFSDGGKKLLFIGNSEINRQIIAHFAKKGGFSLTLCTRAPSQARELQQKYSLSLRSWDVLSNWSTYDLIITSTRTSAPILRLCDIEKKELSTRLICDLGVPRNAEEGLKKHHLLSLLDLEELSAIVNAKRDLSRPDLEEMQHALLCSVWKKNRSFHRYHRKDLQCSGI